MTQVYTLEDCPQRAPHTTFEVVDEQAVIINLNAGSFVSLNETGSFLWQRLDGQTTLGSIAQALADLYGIDASITGPDVLDLVQALQKEDMLA